MNIKWISKDTFTDPAKNIGKTEAQIYVEFLMNFCFNLNQNGRLQKQNDHSKNGSQKIPSQILQKILEKLKPKFMLSF